MDNQNRSRRATRHPQQPEAPQIIERSAPQEYYPESQQDYDQEQYQELQRPTPQRVPVPPAQQWETLQLMQQYQARPQQPVQRRFIQERSQEDWHEYEQEHYQPPQQPRQEYPIPVYADAQQKPDKERKPTKMRKLSRKRQSEQEYIDHSQPPVVQVQQKVVVQKKHGCLSCLGGIVVVFVLLIFIVPTLLNSKTLSKNGSDSPRTTTVSAARPTARPAFSSQGTDARPTKIPDNAAYEIISVQERLVDSRYGDDVFWRGLYEIENTGNVPLYFGVTKYDLTDANGRVLASSSLSSFPDILNPGEKGCFYDSVEVTGVAADTKVICTPRWNIKKSKNARENFDLSNIEIREARLGTTVYGKIANNTGSKQSWAVISVLLYDKNDALIGVWMTNIMEDMPEGASFGFEVALGRTLADDVSADMVSRYVPYAYTVQYQF